MFLTTFGFLLCWCCLLISQFLSLSYFWIGAEFNAFINLFMVVGPFFLLSFLFPSSHPPFSPFFTIFHHFKLLNYFYTLQFGSSNNLSFNLKVLELNYYQQKFQDNLFYMIYRSQFKFLIFFPYLLLNCIYKNTNLLIIEYLNLESLSI